MLAPVNNIVDNFYKKPPKKRFFWYNKRKSVLTINIFQAFMTKKTFIIIVAVLLAIAAAALAYIFFLNPKKSTQSPASDLPDIDLGQANSQGVLPSLDTNPLENKPDINPIDQTNPYKNIKINPFE